MRLLAQAKNLWFSENLFALRSKQIIAAALPGAALLAIKKRYYSRLLKTSTQHLEPDAAALPDLVRSGDFVIDVGAFSGSYTALLSRLIGPTGEVWAFEPVPNTFQILSYCVNRAKFKNVRLFNLALSDACATRTMEVPRFKNGGESWYDARLAEFGSNLRTFQVQTATLDSLLEHLDRPVRFIKCDVEFHELPCIHGALKSIQRWKPILLIEFLVSPDREGTTQHELLRLLRKEEYMPYVFERGKFIGRKLGQFSQNIWFLPPHLVSSSVFANMAAGE